MTLPKEAQTPCTKGWTPKPWNQSPYNGLKLFYPTILTLSKWMLALTKGNKTGKATSF